MSVREDERQKNCPSRGLGIAAAAMGVGVGAALYCFFNKRAENPTVSGSTSDWVNDEPLALLSIGDDDSYTTVSENETTDTSVHDNTIESSSSDSNSGDPDFIYQSQESSSEENDSDASSDDSSVVAEISFTSDDVGEFEEDTTEHLNFHLNQDSGYSNVFGNVYQEDSIRDDESYEESSRIGEDMETDVEWDVTSSSIDVPIAEAVSPCMYLLRSITRAVSNRTQDQKPSAREEAFRQRTWSIEECSICFDKMIPPQELMSLPCTHCFHQKCILPWLQEQTTCPMCRKSAE